MTVPCNIVRGHVVIEGSAPVAGLGGAVVQIGWVKGATFSLMGETRTQSDGQFSFDLSSLSPAGGGSSLLELRVLEGGVRLTAHGNTRFSNNSEPSPLVLCVEQTATCSVPEETIPQAFPGTDNVWGRILHSDGTPLSAVIVQVREVTHNAEVVLSTTTTDAQGWYRRNIPTPKDIVIKVLEPAVSPAPPRLIGSSRAQFSPTYPIRLDVSVCDEAFRRPTEWSRLSTALLPILGATLPQDADTRLAAILSGQSGWDLARITLWVLAHKLGQSIPADSESLYGLLRVGFPRSKESLLARPSSTVGPALSHAATLNLVSVSKSVPPDIDTFVGQLAGGHKGVLGGTRADTLGELLRASGVLTTAQVTDFIGLYVDHVGSESSFWDAVFTAPSSGLASFDAASKAEAQRMITLGTLALAFAPLVASIVVTIGSNPASAVAEIDGAGWSTIVSPARLTSLPDGLPGADDTARRASLAGFLAEHAERRYPAATARKGLLTALGTGHALEDAAAFLTLNPSFDLATSRVDDAALGSTAERDAAKTAQRLYRVAPDVGRATVIADLGAAGFTSAGSIARMTQARFVAQQTAPLGQEVAQSVARRAASLQATATAFYMQAHPNNSQSSFQFLSNADFTTGDLGDWETLFGSTNSCACLECRSIFGPAAYFVELLRWLGSRGTNSTGTIYDLLIARRPDLIELGLTCENAERSLPMIDLVLEVLESAVAAGTSGTPHSSETPGEVDGITGAHDTVVDTQAMLARPQFQNNTAYDNLQGESGAMELPFHQPLEEARAFLLHLGVTRSELLRAYNGVGTIGSTQVSTEQLKLFAERLTTITDTTATEDTYWPVVDLSSLSSLASVPTLLRAAQITWPELLDLLHTQYVNSSGSLAMTATDWCDIDTFTLTESAGTDTAFNAGLGRLRQLLRLWRVVGGSLLELDKTLTALGVTSLASGWLDDLADLHRVSELTGLSVLELSMAVASTIDTILDRDTKEHPAVSLYDATFLSPSLLIAEDAEHASFVLDTARTELDAPSTVASHTAAIAAALALTEDELSVLVSEAGITTLNLAALTTLNAYAVMGRATGLRPANLVALIAMGSPVTTVAGLLSLVETAQRLSAAGWSVDDLRWLLTHESSASVASADSNIQAALGSLRDAVRAAFESLGEGSTEASVRDEIARVLTEHLSLAEGTLDGLRSLTWSGLPSISAGTDFTLAQDASLAVAAQTTEVLVGVQCTLPSGTAILRDTVPEVLSVDTLVVLGATVNGSTTTLRGTQGTAWLTDGSGGASFAVGTVLYAQSTEVPSSATFTDIDGDVITISANLELEVSSPVAQTLTSTLTGTLSFEGSPPSPDLLQRFMRDDFVAMGGSSSYEDIVETGVYADDFEVYRALHKAALMLTRLDLSDAERWFWLDSSTPTTWGVAALDGLSGSGAATFTHAELMKLIELFGLRAKVPGNDPSFVELLASASSTTDFSGALSARTDWTAADMDWVVDPSNAGDLTSVSGLHSVLERLEIVRKLGVSAETVQGWAIAPSAVDDTLSQAVVSAARAQQSSPEAWSAIARPIRDVLRKAQRDALVAWLLLTIGSDSIQNADDLYQHYLIDVSMNPELLTSRIVQASASVQLYVHRLMLGLEQSGGSAVFSPNAEDREQWEWMRNYRVWQAARKVFLYPENWIEPELRDDKTPLFLELEQTLAQGDLSDERVEDSVLSYLDQLREISNLEILAHIWQQESLDGVDEIDSLHVFARTRSTPATYWYRRFEDHMTWSPWEKVECGIQGEHLVPVVYQKRLLLFWATFNEATDAGADASHQEVRLAWSEYRDGWLPQRVSVGVPVEGDPEGIVVLRDLSVDGPLRISVSSKYSAQMGYNILQEYLEISAEFTLSPCTLLLESVATSGEQRRTRASAVNATWVSPGFRTGYSPGLAVYFAEPGETEPLDKYLWEELELLASPESVAVVIPANSDDFVSQAPFFVQQPEQCWLVLPDGAETESMVGAVGSMRHGTLVPTEPFSAPAPEWSSYLSAEIYSGLHAATAVDSSASIFAAEASPAAFGTLGSRYRFYSFYHPHVCAFTEAVRRDGVFALLDPDPNGPENDLRRQAVMGDFVFSTEMLPHPDNVDPRYPEEDVDFSGSGAYSQYNWELFFHVPIYLANRLMDSGRHEQAMRYLHTIFDPRVPESELGAGADPTSWWWKVAPLLEPASAPVTDWIAFSGAGDADAMERFADDVRAWVADPFNPHLIARMRPGTYAKNTVMRYLDNLIAWGDRLFTQDSIESLNEATQLYVYALQVLGERPVTLEPANKPASKTYSELLSTLDAFGNAVENSFTGSVDDSGTGSTLATLGATALSSYFCIPQNPQLVSYWDILDDRLFKIRNGMNIEGVARSLALFQPVIDPAMLVQAAAAGIDIGTALDDLSMSLPHHRFAVLHARATGITASVRSLGQSLLSALEKTDGETMASLRQEQEVTMLDAIGELRSQRIEEAQTGLESSQLSRVLVQGRLDYYAGLMEKGWLGKEKAAAVLTGTAAAAELTAGVFRVIQSGLGAAPDVEIGVPCNGVTTGGANMSRPPDALASSFQIAAGAARGAAAYLGTAAAYQRRTAEWEQQAAMATKELDQIDKQIAAAEIRLEISKREQSNHNLQVTQSQQVQEFYSRKFTSEQLYRWMSSQLSTLYFQQYQLALATAKKAQACFNYELSRSDTYVQSVHWDSTRKGLLAGDRLAADLERMDVAYLENDRRELELTKAVSLARLDPMALARLREDGECYFQIPEVLFDLDCPGHYLRRISSVAVTVACVSGTQGQVNMTLTMHGSQIRGTSTGDLDTELCSYPSIVTSTAIEDAGVFSANDGRYMPFERKGAVSRWHLAFSNQQYKQLDWDSVSDVVVHLRYTARDGGATLRSDRLGDIPAELLALAGGFSDTGVSSASSKLVVGLSAKRDDPDAWFQAQEAGADNVTLSLMDRLPYFAAGQSLQVTGIHALLVGGGSNTTDCDIAAGTSSETGLTFTEWPTSGSSTFKAGTSTWTALSTWPDEVSVLNLVAGTALDLSTADDLLVILEIELS